MDTITPYLHLSIVTTTYNNINSLLRTFESVFNHLSNKSISYEYIIIDSSSNSAIRDFIRQEQLSARIPCLKYLYVPPQGPYDAMNHGIRTCFSRYVWILNAGDEIISLPLNFSTLLASLDLPLFGAVTKTTQQLHPYGKLNYSSFYNFRLHELHPACIIPLYIYNKIGVFHPSAGVAADLHFLLRVAKSFSFYFISDLVVYYPSGGISSQQRDSPLQMSKTLLSSRNFIVAPFFLARYLYSLMLRF